MSDKDLSLAPWGPWSRVHVGLSRLIGGPNRAMLDIVPVVARMRGATLVGDVNGECGVHLMEASANLDYIRYRYQIQWRDREYADLHFIRVDKDAHLIRAEFVNNTNVDHRYVLASFAGMRAVDAQIPVTSWIGAEDYDYLRLPEGEWLRAGRDGLRRLVCAGQDLVNGRGVGNWGSEPGLQPHQGPLPEGTSLKWKLPSMTGDGKWYLRSISECDATPVLCVNDTEMGIDSGVNFQSLEVADHIEMQVVKDATGRWAIDGFLWVPEGQNAESLITFQSANSGWTWHRETNQSPMGVTAQDSCYQNMPIAMMSAHERDIAPPPYDNINGEIHGGTGMVHLRHNNLGDMAIRRRLVGDSLMPWGDHNNDFSGDGGIHYMGYLMGPERVNAGERVIMDLVLVCGEGIKTEKAADTKARQVLLEANKAYDRARIAFNQENRLWSGSKFERDFQTRLAAQTLANVVYPVAVGNNWIRTYTPGKRWSSLFTWDAGMHAIGLSAIEPARAWELIDQYCMPVMEGESPCVLHGSLLPLTIYAADMAWREDHNNDAMIARLPALVAIWRWFTGLDPSSPYDPAGTGMLSTYIDFYNGAGMDDHPFQHWIDHHLKRTDIANIAATSHCLRATRLIQDMAHVAGDDSLLSACEAFMERASTALDSAWDIDSGWYAWTDLKTGEWVDTPFGKGGAANMTMDGASALVTDTLSDEQRMILLSHLDTEEGLWTRSGITAVAGASASRRKDGYWNGAVWVPHQWFFFMACLSQGSAERAARIGETMLRVWATATNETDFVYELVDTETGQGEGHHAFGGLSSPLLMISRALRERGRVTTGWDQRVIKTTWDDDKLSVVMRTERVGSYGVLIAIGEPAQAMLILNDVEREVVCSPEGLIVFNEQFDKGITSFDLKIIK